MRPAVFALNDKKGRIFAMQRRFSVLLADPNPFLCRKIADVLTHQARICCVWQATDLPQFEKIVRATVKSTKLPVTVKTRLGWDQESIVIEDVARMVADAGAKALTIHCRTRGPARNKSKADWSWLEKVKKVRRKKVKCECTKKNNNGKQPDSFPQFKNELN